MIYLLLPILARSLLVLVNIDPVAVCVPAKVRLTVLGN